MALGFGAISSGAICDSTAVLATSSQMDILGTGILGTFADTPPASGENNTSLLSSAILTLIGSVPTCENFDNSTSELSAGLVTFISTIVYSASSTLLGADAYTVTIQGTLDLYYLSDSMSGFAVDYYPYHESDIREDLVGLVLVVNNSRATHTHTILGPEVIDLSYLQDYYYRIHLSIINLDFGNVLSEQNFVIEVWNSYFVTDNLASITQYNTAGLTLTPPFAIPHTFNPLENALVTLNATPTGTPIIDGSYTFNFGTESVTLYVTGRRVILWPFAPLSTFSESREWVTDVITVRDNETRYSMRAVPRVTLKYDYLFQTSEQYALANSMAKELANLALGIPLWTDVTKLHGISAGATIVYFPTANLEIKVGSVVVFWTSFKDYELAEVSLVYSDRIVLTQPLLRSHSSCWIVPVLIGYTANGIDVSESPNFGRKGSLQVTSIDNYYSAIWNNAVTFQSLPVLTDTSVVTGGLSTRYSREMESFDSITGQYSVFDVESYNRTVKTLSFVGTDKAEIFALRRLFDYMQGKYITFWLPSFTEDIVALAPVVSGSASLHVVNNFFETYPPKYIRIVGENTQMFEIASISDNLDGTAYLTFTAVASANINTIKRIEKMTKVRLNSDTVEFAHKGKGLATVKAPAIEVKA